ncbi:hypothetical protein ON010_g5274 [Phytophthora cinnamomi]|nr:hypothetical protein ON010_g5274 [Phytophthora cinnamomi]
MSQLNANAGIAETTPVTGGVTTAEIAEASLTNALAMATVTRRTSAPGDANSASKSMSQVGGARRPPRYLRAEGFIQDGPSTSTGLDNIGLPQSAEPAVEANFVFAFDGKAQRPEIMSGEEEGRRAITSMVRETQLSTHEPDHATTMRRRSGERMGWWSASKYDRRVCLHALVMGALNDKRTQMLLDTGENVSVISESFAKRLRLKCTVSNDRQINVQGVNKGKLSTTARAMVKVTLGCQLVYESEVWIMSHYAGVDLILGTDFMILAAVRLELFNATAKLPDEVVIPLLKSRAVKLDESPSESRESGGPAESMSIQPRLVAEFALRRRQPSSDTHDLWVRRTKVWIPTVVCGSRNKPTKVFLTNVSEKLVWCPAHFSVILWLLHRELPPDDGFVRLNSAKCRDWQVLAYETAIDKSLLRKEHRLYDDCMANQPPVVETTPYRTMLK